MHPVQTALPQMYPLIRTANKAMADLVRYAAEFGMTLSARSRITAAPPSDKEADKAAA